VLTTKLFLLRVMQLRPSATLLRRKAQRMLQSLALLSLLREIFLALLLPELPRLYR
jgi:hypothetical protein